MRDINGTVGCETRFGNDATLTAANMSGLAPNTSKVVSFNLLSGIFSQPTMLPIQYCPITCELELASSNLHPTIDPSVGVGAFTAANTSSTWSITEPQTKCDLCDLDNAVENKLAEKLLPG